MKLNAKNITIFGVPILLIIAVYFWIGNSSAPKIETGKISASAIIDYPPEFNYRQTINNCGPFNVAAVIRSLMKKNVNSEEFSKNIGWRLPNGYTFPRGIENQLKKNGIKIEIPNIKNLSDEDKIIFLHERLSQGKPVIILGERDKYEHYITIFGFNSEKNEFHAYDSLFDEGEKGLTKDDNDSLPGNRNLTSGDLLNFWRGGGMYGGYEWFAIVAGK